MTLRVLAAPGMKERKVNPYTWLLYSHMSADVHDFSYRRAMFGRYNVVHLHWPEGDLNWSRNFVLAKLRLQRQFAVLDHLRARGTRIMWTAHNLAAHDRRFPNLEGWFWESFTKRLDGFIALTETGKSAAEARFPSLRNIPGFVVAHGHYRGEYSPCSEPRPSLGISKDKKVILFFGQLRAYKNVTQLIDNFKAFKDENAMLIIAGRPTDTNLRAEVLRAARSDTRILMKLEHIVSEEASYYFGSADLVILPYKEILNSGTALLALSMNKPVLVPNRGALGELAKEIGGEWVRCYEGELTTQEIAKGLSWALQTRRSLEAPLEHLSWDCIAGQTLEAYQTVVRMKRGKQ
jgi:glycosyltransferase involved in cell wall biosynthesis